MYLLAARIRIIRTRGTDTLAHGLFVQCIVHLTDEQNLCTASRSELRGIKREPVSLC